MTLDQMEELRLILIGTLAVFFAKQNGTEEATLCEYTLSEVNAEFNEFLKLLVQGKRPVVRAHGESCMSADTVPMPTNRAQADAMVAVALAWLRDNAMGKLDDTGLNKPLTHTPEIK